VAVSISVTIQGADGANVVGDPVLAVIRHLTDRAAEHPVAISVGVQAKAIWRARRSISLGLGHLPLYLPLPGHGLRRRKTVLE